ncbi:trypsin-like peptidase domain-containing protein [Pedobacter sp. MW01-1-1]|uniref:trypsin-like peptidase domain-containing protein n=1 Tax=Pedobacter sp. MW01-1-1 TaxID=3383027 RepID=UPI003FF0132F
MTIRIKYTITTILVTSFITTGLYAQSIKKETKKAFSYELFLAHAIKKAYPASVRMWSFDVKRNERTGAQFSGVVVTKDGYILTAAHTVEPGNTYKVFFADGKECIAVALGKMDNKETPGIPDMGMMKIQDKGDWPFAEMGYSSSLVKTEPCISISYPESLNQTLPTIRLGQIADIKNTYGFIQSTCKMEPGDSGGPLFDYMGRVIGLHSAIDVAEDMNFEVRIDLYRKYWNAMKKEVFYRNFPTEIDSIGEDPLARKIKQDQGKKFNHPSFSVMATKNIASVFLIESERKGKIDSIEATLINVKTGSGLKQVLISKNTELGNHPMLIEKTGKMALSILYQDKENDLVLLSSAQFIKGGISMENFAKETDKTLGKLVLVSLHSNQYLSGIAGNNAFNSPKITSQPYLGAMVAYNSSPAVFTLIKEESPVVSTGIKMGDELISINAKPIKNWNEFAPEISKFWPQDKITLEWKSEGQIKSKQVVLAGRNPVTSNHPVEKFEGGKSIRRDGFNRVFSIDVALKPKQCGSAVFDSDGVFYGICIARYSRAVTFVLPADIVKGIIEAHVN